MVSRITSGALGWLAGTAWQLQQAALGPWSHYALLFSASLSLMLGLLWPRPHALNRPSVQPLKPSHGFSAFTATLAATGITPFLLAFTLAFAQAGWRAAHHQTHALNPALEGRTLLVDGVVASLPQRMGDSVRFRLEVIAAQEPNTHASNAQASNVHAPNTQGEEVAHDEKVDPIGQQGQPVQLPPELLLGWYGSSDGLHTPSASALQARPPADLKPGERWQFAVRLKAPHGHVNPHGFDYELWLWEQGVHATGYVRTGAKDPQPVRLGSTWQHPIALARDKARQAIEAQVADRATAGIVAALLVGDQAAIERADWDVFRATGVAHLMAISGLHITGLAWLAMQLVAWGWRRSDVWAPQRPWSLWLPAPLAGRLGGVAVALAYALFSGWGVPAQRTVWMLALVTGLRALGLRWPWPQVWLSVCALVLALDPWAGLQAGFWLSFVAVGLLFAADSRQTPSPYPSPLSRAWAAARRLWREQWLMSVCLAPLSLLLFQQVSIVGFFANLWAVPWVTLVVTPLCLLGLAWPAAWSWAGEALQALVWVLEVCAQVPWAQWSAPAVPLWVGAAALLGAGLWALALPWGLRCFGVALVLPLLGWQAPRPAPSTFEVLAADMGQGHAVLVRTARHSLLYDTGPRYSAETDAGQRVLVPLLRALGERLDRVVLSHQDSDHSGGAQAVLAMQPQAEVLTSIATAHPLARAQQGVAFQRCERGQAWVWDGVRFDVLHPAAADYKGPHKPNALSCVLRISTPESAALLVGDIEAAQEAALVRSGQALQADWLLVPHHGSATSSTQAFLDAVRPRVAVVQAGYRNRFGHPKAEVVARYQQLGGVRLVKTVTCGAAGWRSDAPERVRCERHDSPRYWRRQMADTP